MPQQKGVVAGRRFGSCFVEFPATEVIFVEIRSTASRTSQPIWHAPLLRPMRQCWRRVALPNSGFSRTMSNADQFNGGSSSSRETLAKNSTDAVRMDIQKAKDIFRECGRDLATEHENVVDFCRKNRVSAPLSNGNFLHALTLTELLFRHCDQSFRMVTGGAGDGFLGCLRNQFSQMLARLRANGGDARIVVVDGDTESGILHELVGKYEGTLCVRAATAPTGKLVQHYMVADGEMVRDEEPHEPIDNGSDAGLIRAKVYFHSPGVAELFTKRHDRVWDRLSATVA